MHFHYEQVQCHRHLQILNSCRQKVFLPYQHVNHKAVYYSNVLLYSHGTLSLKEMAPILVTRTEVSWEKKKMVCNKDSTTHYSCKFRQVSPSCTPCKVTEKHNKSGTGKVQCSMSRDSTQYSRSKIKWISVQEEIACVHGCPQALKNRNIRSLSDDILHD